MPGVLPRTRGSSASTATLFVGAVLLTAASSELSILLRGTAHVIHKKKLNGVL